MNPSSAALQLNKVTKQFGRKANQLALRPISLTIQPGEFVCVVGPSGCGKSTLFNLIAKLDKPTSGTVEVNGKLGFMFQEAALFPWLSVERNVGFGLRIAGVNNTERQQRIHQALADVRLTDWAGHYPHELSGGMRQRVALARTLVMDPDIILMDEPFSALDAQTRENLHEYLQILWAKNKKTVVFVTHDIREACFLADRIVVLSKGPGEVLDILTNQVPRPRDYFDARLDDIAKQVRTLLTDPITV